MVGVQLDSGLLAAEPERLRELRVSIHEEGLFPKGIHLHVAEILETWSIHGSSLAVLPAKCTRRVANSITNVELTFCYVRLLMELRRRSQEDPVLHELQLHITRIHIPFAAECGPLRTPH